MVKRFSHSSFRREPSTSMATKSSHQQHQTTNHKLSHPKLNGEFVLFPPQICIFVPIIFMFRPMISEKLDLLTFYLKTSSRSSSVYQIFVPRLVQVFCWLIDSTSFRVTHIRNVQGVFLWLSSLI